MHFDDLIRQLGAELHLPDWAPDETGACAVLFDGLNVSFHPDGDGGFSSICVLGRADPDDGALQELLLKGNFFTDGVGANALGMTAQGHVALVERFALTDLSFPRFQQSLELFISAAEYWRGQIASSVQAH
jgi:hypothetical protein